MSNINNDVDDDSFFIETDIIPNDPDDEDEFFVDQVATVSDEDVFDVSDDDNYASSSSSLFINTSDGIILGHCDAVQPTSVEDDSPVNPITPVIEVDPTIVALGKGKTRRTRAPRVQKKQTTLATLKEKCKLPPPSKTPRTRVSKDIDEVRAQHTASSRMLSKRPTVKELAFGSIIDFKEHLQTNVRKAEHSNFLRVQEMIDFSTYGEVPKTSQSTSSSALSSSSGTSSSSGSSSTLRPLPKSSLTRQLFTEVPLGVWTLPAHAQLHYIDEIYEKICKEHDIPKAPDLRSVEACPAKHARLMMSQKYGRIRNCRMEDRCICNSLYGFIMREYLSPSEHLAFVSDTRREFPTLVPNFCYLCHLYCIHNDYFNNGLKRDGSASTISLPFYHITDKYGEYKKEYTIQPRSMSHVNTDINPYVFKSELPMSTAETTHGLTMPVRCLSKEHYVLEIRTIETTYCEKKEINGLREIDAVIFKQHSTTIESPEQVRPLQYMQKEISYIPSTADILIILFSRGKNPDHNIGYRRLQQYGRYIDPVTFAITPLSPELMLHKWCSIHAFPWRYFFCKDIRETVAHLPEILDIACIDIDAMLKQSPDVDTFFAPSLPPGKYSLFLHHYDYLSYYIAMRLRLAMLTTLIAIYPDSKNTPKDVTMHTRLHILLRWNREHYEQYMYCGVEQKPRKDIDVDDAHIDAIVASELPYHLYSADYQYYKYKMVLVKELPPRKEIKRFMHSRYHWLFSDFEKMRVSLARCFHNERRYFSSEDLGIYADITTDWPYLAPADPSFLAHSDYSAYVTALLRINVASAIHAKLLASVEAANSKMISLRCDESKRVEYGRLERYRDFVRRNRYNLRLFIFTHIELIQRMNELGDYSDTKMFSRHANKNPNYCLSHYREVYPYDTCMYYEGMLPDLSPIIYCVPFPSTTSIVGTDVSTTASTSQLHSVMRMLSSFMQHTYHARVNIKQHLKVCTENSAYKKLTSIILEICFLGTYQHSDHMPRFEQAVEFHRLFACSHNTPRFHKWQENHATLTMLAMREFVVFTVKLCPPYHHFLMNTYPWWIRHCRQVYALTNVLRMSCASGNALVSIQHAIQNTSRSLSRTNISPTILNHINRYTEDLADAGDADEDMAPPQKINVIYTLCQQLFTFNALLTKHKIDRPAMPHLLIKCIERFVKLFPRNTPINVAWLDVFNFGTPNSSLHSDTIEILRCIFNFIERGKLDKIKSALMLIPRRDYEIIDCYFHNLLTHNSTTIFQLSKEIRSKQIAAIHRRYELTPNSLVSSHIYSLILAECCGTIKSYITSDATPFSFGSDTVGINVTEGTFVCKRKDPHNNLQKQAYRVATQVDHRFNKYIKDGDEAQTQKLCERLLKSTINQTQRRFLTQPKCEETPVTFLPLIGNVVEITSSQVLRTITTEPTTNAFTVCTTCGGVMAFSTRLFGSNGLSCNECSIVHTKEFQTPDCIAKYHKVKSDWKHPFYVLDDRPDVGTWNFVHAYVCHHCFARKTSNFVEFGENMLTATCLQKCKHFAKHRLQLDLDFVLGRSINDLFDPEISNFALKIYSAKNRFELKRARH